MPLALNYNDPPQTSREMILLMNSGGIQENIFKIFTEVKYFSEKMIYVVINI